MSFRAPNGSGPGAGPTPYYAKKAAPPKNYVAGIGRGAAGFTTRSDVGPMMPSSSSSSNREDGDNSGPGGASASLMSTNGSRAAEARAALKLQSSQPSPSPWGAAPAHYVPGAGRGAGKMGDMSAAGGGPGVTAAGDSSGGGGAPNNARGGASSYSSSSRSGGRHHPDVEGQFDDHTMGTNEDDEADQIWAAIDERMQSRRRNKRKHDDNGVNGTNDDTTEATTSSKIGAQFRELKEQLSTVSMAEWEALPDTGGDYTLKYKQKRRQQDTFTPLSDSLLDQRHKNNMESNATLSGTAQVMDPGNPDEDDLDGTKTTLTTSRLSGLSVARGTMLGMSLDKAGTATAGDDRSVAATTSASTNNYNSSNYHTNNIDASGYLTSLASSASTAKTTAELGDLSKARLLLKSVRDTNPHTGAGWIAAARVEEAAGQTLAARKLIQDACSACPTQEDVWLEAARLHATTAEPNVNGSGSGSSYNDHSRMAKSILAAAARAVPGSVKIFVKAAELEVETGAKKAVLRKAVQANPTSVSLWKALIELEESDEDVKVLLAVAVEQVPTAVELWLAWARLEDYDKAREVLNRARKALPGERSIWMAAARLEEGQEHTENVHKIVTRAVQSLRRRDAVITRAQWIEEAQAAEGSGAPVTSAAIIKATIGQDVDEEDRLRTWTEDAKAVLASGAIATARAILEHALVQFPTKRGLWMQAVDLEKRHAASSTAAAAAAATNGHVDTNDHAEITIMDSRLDDILARACEKLPSVEIFWLLRAKEWWLANQVEKAREVLTNAFAANPQSEAIWLAAAKLEWETGEIEIARVLLQRARERAPTDRVYMKSAQLEREQGDLTAALKLVEEGIRQYPNFPKLYMMGGQICSEDLDKTPASLDRARKFYQEGLESCPNNTTLWILTSRLEEQVAALLEDASSRTEAASSNRSGSTKARGILELARLTNPKNPELWLESIRLEGRSGGSSKMADTLMARSLQECPKSGLLLAEQIYMAPRVEKKSKSAVAIKRCPDDPLVICSVATFFWSEGKIDKARKWLDRAAVLNPDLGDSWGRLYALELDRGTKQQQSSVRARCIAADPKHGALWTSIMKDLGNRGKSVAEGLELVAHKILGQVTENR